MVSLTAQGSMRQVLVTPWVMSTTPVAHLSLRLELSALISSDLDPTPQEEEAEARTHRKERSLAFQRNLEDRPQRRRCECMPHKTQA